MTVTISRLTEADWRIFSQIRLKALQTDPTVFASTYQKESQFTETDWRSRLNNNTVFLLCDGSNPIGLTGVSVYLEDTTGKTAIFWGSWLESDFRGKKLSNLMYRTRLDWAKQQPLVERILVSHRASNLASKYANQKYGFTLSHTEEMVWSDGATEDLLSYELKLK